MTDAECTDCGSLIETYQAKTTGMCRKCETRKRNVAAAHRDCDLVPKHPVLQ